MFRLAEYAEGTPLFIYLSTIASATISEALGFALDVYEEAFIEETEGDFFRGISQYIAGDSDGQIGLELIFRKLNRMKEKMDDPDHFYTFDLFEEYLFHAVIELNGPFTGDFDQQIEETKTELEEKFGLEYAGEVAECVWRIEKMGIDDSDMFFWDEDYAFVFDEGFVNGIRKLVGGSAAMMGYGYDDVCAIFTDAGIRAPLLLVGSREAFDVVGEVTMEQMAEAVKNTLGLDYGLSLENRMQEDDITDEDLPFS